MRRRRSQERTWRELCGERSEAAQGEKNHPGDEWKDEPDAGRKRPEKDHGGIRDEECFNSSYSLPAEIPEADEGKE